MLLVLVTIAAALFIGLVVIHFLGMGGVGLGLSLAFYLTIFVIAPACLLVLLYGLAMMAVKKWLKPESEIEKRIREARLEATQTDENIRLNRRA